MKIRFLTYSDPHYSEKNLNDVLKVEEQIDEYFLDNGMDFILFLGDRFKSRNPSGPLRDIADGVLKRRNDKKIPMYLLVGNHDQYDKTGGTNSYGVAKMFEKEMGYITVMDKVQWYYWGDDKVAISSFPSGCEYTDIFVSNNKLFPGELEEPFKILAFHALIKETILHLESGYRIKGGMTLKDIDRPEFDIVLGGDNHIPQMFDLEHTVGGYVGSVLQLTKADVGDSRGFLDITLEKGEEPDVKFVESCAPKLIFIEDDAGKYRDWKEGVPFDGSDVEGNRLTLTLEGSGNVVDELSRDKGKLEECLKEAWQAESVGIVFKRRVEFSESVEGMAESRTPEGDLRLYLDSEYGEKSVGELNKNKLYEVGVSLLKE